MEWWKTSHAQSQSGPAKTMSKPAKRTKVACAQGTLLAFVGKKGIEGEDIAIQPELPESSVDSNQNVSETLEKSVIVDNNDSNPACSPSQQVPNTPSADRVDEIQAPDGSSSVVCIPSSPSQVEPARRSARLKNLKSQPVLKEDLSSDEEFQPKKCKAPISKGRLFFLTREEKEKLKAEEERRLKEEEEERQRERERQHCEKLREEIRRAKEENLERSQGRQTNPFLLPRAPAQTQAIVIDGDEDTVKACAVQWEDDRDGTLWPFPIITHVKQLEHAQSHDFEATASDFRSSARWSSGLLNFSDCADHTDAEMNEECVPFGDIEPNVNLTAYKEILPDTSSGQTDANKPEHAHIQAEDCLIPIDVDRLSQISGWAVEAITELHRQLLSRQKGEDRRKQWVDLYRPRSSRDICGNKKEIQSLRRWLLEHYAEAGSKRPKSAGRSGRSDSDEENEDEEEPQAMLLVGPSGSGKSASVYALAEELQLQVLEINSSDKRSGRLVLEKVGEATRSQSLSKRVAESTSDVAAPLMPEPTEKRKGLKGLLGKSKKTKEEILLEEAANGTGPKALILFEEIDVLSDHDKGFLAALTALVSQTCVPIIMTCERVPSAMEGLGLREIKWSRPDMGAFLVHLYLTAAVENCSMSVEDCMMLYKSCAGDLRQALMLSQLASIHPRKPHLTASTPSTLPGFSCSSELPSALKIAQAAASLDEFKSCKPIFKAGMQVCMRPGSSGSSAHLECPAEFLEQIFNVAWTPPPHDSSLDLHLKRKHELQTADALSQHADDVSLASVLAQAQHRNEAAGRAFAGGSIPGCVASILAASLHVRLQRDEAAWLIAPLPAAGRGTPLPRRWVGELVHPPAAGVGRYRCVMRERVPWVRDMCVAELHKAALASSRRRRTQVHLSGLPRALVDVLCESSFDSGAASVGIPSFDQYSSV